jgi:hypothetical protein
MVSATVTVGTDPTALVFLPPTPQPPVACPGIPGISSRQDIFIDDTDHYVALQWCASPSTSVVRYLISRNGREIGSVPSSGPLNFTDHDLKKGKTYTYTIVAVTSTGQQSTPLTYTIKIK